MDRLFKYLLQFYREEEFPALLEQYRVWSEQKPFAGVRLLDATPVFRNTFAKYLPLLAGGADLTVVYGRSIPCDSTAVAALGQFGIRTAGEAELKEKFDVVMDCAGGLCHVRSRCGYVELTRSGMYYYQTANMPVFLADEGRIKVIETGLGTGDGFRRGLEKLGYRDFSGRHIVVFGCGKVGRGVAMYALWKGARVTLVDDPARGLPPKGAEIIDFKHRAAVDAALKDAWCMVSATGRRDALAGCFDVEKLVASSTLIANMGVEDEFGAGIPAERVLNQKAPLNFILDEPTHLKFIDPTMALDNYGALKLLTESGLPSGLVMPSRDEEDRILRTVREKGAIAEELAKMEAMQ